MRNGVYKFTSDSDVLEKSRYSYCFSLWTERSVNQYPKSFYTCLKRFTVISIIISKPSSSALEELFGVNYCFPFYSQVAAQNMNFGKFLSSAISCPTNHPILTTITSAEDLKFPFFLILTIDSILALLRSPRYQL